jgi:hypothetical protein
VDTSEMDVGFVPILIGTYYWCLYAYGTDCLWNYMFMGLKDYCMCMCIRMKLLYLYVWYVQRLGEL